MTEKRFTIILDYDGEIGVKENHSGDVIVLNHRDLNSEQFVAQLVMFLNEQNDAIVKLINGEKYWEEKAIERINGLEKENNELKEERRGFESCSHNWRILYDEAKKKVETLTKENRELEQENEKLENKLWNCQNVR